MNIQVTSASKKAESLSAAPAAIFVITGEDIRRGGFSSVPDALRTVPGLHVVQQNAHVWIVAARGFSSLFNGKMLVLIDGRLVYSPTVWRGMVGCARPSSGRHRADRSDPRAGRHPVGSECDKWRDQHYHERNGENAGALVSTSAGIDEGYAARVRFGGKLGEKLTTGFTGPAMTGCRP